MKLYRQLHFLSQWKARDYHVISATLHTTNGRLEGSLKAHEQRVPVRACRVRHDVGIAVAGAQRVDAVDEVPVCAAVRGLVQGVVGARCLCSFGPVAWVGPIHRRRDTNVRHEGLGAGAGHDFRLPILDVP